MKKFFSKFSLKSKLIFSFAMVGILPAICICFISYFKNVASFNDLAKQQLILSRETKATQIEDLFEMMSKQVQVLSNNKATIDAINAFNDGYNDIFEAVSENVNKNQMRESVNSYYKNKYAMEYSKLNASKISLDLEGFVNGLSDNSLALQYSYISNNKFPLGEKHKLDQSEDSSWWTESHLKFHKNFKTFSEKFGYYDIFLVGPKNGIIVYSVFKELDFATSLKTGPYAQSGLGEAYRKAINSQDGSFVGITDMNKYTPSYDAPAAFISSPIIVNNETVGVVIFQIPVEKIDDIMTSKKKWKEMGFGETGETYLVGRDKKMRSMSRFLSEDPAGYENLLQGLGVSKETLDYIKIKNTTVISQLINTEGVESVLRNETGFKIFEDYRGVNVLSAYKPLNIKGLNWYLLSEMDESEALASVLNLRNVMIITLTISIILICFFSFIFSGLLAKSIKSIAEVLTRESNKVSDISVDIVGNGVKLSESTVEQASSLQETVSSITEISNMINKNSEAAENSRGYSERSEVNAREGKISIDNMLKAISEISDTNTDLMVQINQSNVQISEIVKLISDIEDKTKIINDIVFQTKLLSFNASIEAARAGEHGKGFSVVAEEVGNLAKVSGTAAREISEMLESSIKKVQDIVKNSQSKIDSFVVRGKEKVDLGRNRAKECEKALDEILDNVSQVNRVVVEIASACKEQSLGVNEITKAMNELDTVTQQNTILGQESLTSGEELKDQSFNLHSSVQMLLALVDGDIGREEKVRVPDKNEIMSKSTLKKEEKNTTDMSSDDDSRFKDVI